MRYFVYRQKDAHKHKRYQKHNLCGGGKNKEVATVVRKAGSEEPVKYINVNHEIVMHR